MPTATSEEISVPAPVDPEIDAMMKAGVHFGHARRKRNAGMIPYIWGVRNNVEIIDLAKTKEKLAEALVFLKQAAAGSKLFLFVGTRPSAKSLIKGAAEELGCPYSGERWIGGTITNFKVVRKRVDTLEDLEREKASGGLEKYTKKERMKMEEELAKLRRNFDGLRLLTRLPDVVVIMDTAYDDLASKEARRAGIAIVALTDTNSDPRIVSYPIPSNNDARSAVAYMLGRMKNVILEGRHEARIAESALAQSAGESENSKKEESLK